MTDLPYRDPSLGTSERVADLLDRMTVEEKLAQIGGIWLTSLVTGHRVDPDKVLDTIPHGVGHVTRIGASTGLRPAESATLMNELQRVVVDGTRLGIPVVVHEESTGGYCARDATVFPQAIGLAATWDDELVEEVAAAIRRQLLAVGARHTLAPVLDVARDPRWGRVEETYGESPYLCGRIGSAYVRGMQSSDLRNGVIATGKHFLGYGLSEGGMNHAPVHLGPRELREVFAEPFAAAIRDAGLASVMNSYASVDGLPCAGSPAILDDLLRLELGFDGVVVADYNAVVLLAAHHRTASDKGSAAAMALTAGLDLELPEADCFGAPLKEQIDSGLVDLALVDRAATRVLESKFRLGLFENPYVEAGAAAAAFDTPADRALSRRAAASSLVLLTNDGVLPFSPGTRIAVLGPAADDPRLLQGDYHYPAHVEIVYEAASDNPALLPEGGADFAPGPYYTPHVTPLAALSAACEVVHVKGCSVTGDDDLDVEGAVAAARSTEVAVVFVGGRSGLRPSATVGEARDATDLRLTGHQPALVAAVAATGTPTVVVVVSGRVHELTDTVAQAMAVMLAWCPGEEGGAAIADALLGAVEPGGRLPVTLPRSVGQVPVHHDVRAGGGRSSFYGDYTDSPSAPLFPFGHGLGYTSFEHTDLAVASASTADPVRVRLAVTNRGERPGSEVVQLYMRDLVASVARPWRQLVGYHRMTLEPGETATIEFVVHPSRLAFYDPRMRFVTEPGDYLFMVGASSHDIRLSAKATLTGDTVRYLQREIIPTEVHV